MNNTALVSTSGWHCGKRRTAEFHPASADRGRHADPAYSGATAYARSRYLGYRRTAAGRTPVTTVAIPDSRRRHEIIERVRSACRDENVRLTGSVLIDESDLLESPGGSGHV